MAEAGPRRKQWTNWRLGGPDAREGSLEDEDSPQPEVARIRRKVHGAGRDGRVRSKTIAPKRLTRDERRLSELLVYPEDVERPMTREECSRCRGRARS